MQINAAVIGFGGMGSYHCKNIRERVSEIKVTGAYDVREEAKNEIVKQKLFSYEKPEALYEDKSVGLVIIATPNDVHKAYAIECLEAGKNVICEKPVTLNAAEFEEIVAAAKRTGKIFTAHQNRRWDKDYLTIKKILSDGILHKPYIIESRVQGSRRALHGWRAHKANGGGMVLDWGVHLIDQLLDLIDSEVVSVDAHLHFVNNDEVDDNFTTMIRFASGPTAVVNVSMNCFVTQPRWHMQCFDGTAVINDWELNGKIVKLANPDALEWADDIIYTAAGPTRSMAPRPDFTTEELSLPKVESDWSEYYKNVVRAIRGVEEPIVKQCQLLRVMRVIDAVFESHRTGASIKTNI